MEIVIADFVQVSRSNAKFLFSEGRWTLGYATTQF